MTGLARIKGAIERLSPEERRELALWFDSSSVGKREAGSGSSAKEANPAVINRRLLPGFKLQRIPMGWKGKFPGRPQLFGRPVVLIVETEKEPDFSKLPAPLSSLQAGLVQSIAGEMPSILKRAQKEVGRIGMDAAEEGSKLRLNIYVWLHVANDDGKSWEFVVERADGSNFAYHLAYQGTRFVEVWAGD